MKLKQLRFLIFILFFGLLYACATHSHTTKKTVSHTVKKNPPQERVQIQEQTRQQSREQTRKSESEKIVEKEQFDEPLKPIVKNDKIEEEPEVRVELPEVNREFRAAWIASVANINWPSKKGLTTEQQKEEAIQILDILKENNFNAVILQVRPSADALYESPYEPWSIFLTGVAGDHPKPYYDPLEFWIEEAHKRGLELHAWINPYRAHHTNGGKITQASIVNKMPNEVVKLSNGMYWFDPAKKQTQNHVSDVVMDIVKRYDVDGIHFDDYFYPYSSYNNGADFPDQQSWNVYINLGGTLSKADWRRENVNNFIQRIYTQIKTEKNWVKFGISPFGIWKPGYPSDVSGMSQYDQLYADAKLWLNKGWIDYFTPQLYWPTDAPKQNFVSLLKWWESENTFKRHLWPGLNTVEVKSVDRPTEIIKQITETRKLLPNDAGVVHWSMAGLTSGMLISLKNGPYKEKALIPQSSWLTPIISGKPKLKINKEANTIKAEWSFSKPNEVKHWVIYLLYGDKWETEILDTDTNFKNFPESKDGKKLSLVAVKAIDRIGGESDYIARKLN